MSVPDIEVVKSDKYEEVFANRILGGVRNGYFEYEIITESSDFTQAMKDPNFRFDKTVLKRTIHEKIIMPPSTFLEVLGIMQKHKVDYESIFGKIPTSKEIQDKSGPKDLR